MSDILIKTKSLKTSYNQDYEEILNKNGKLIFGKINIYFNNKSITSHCSIGLNGFKDRKGVGLFGDDSGIFVIEVDQKINTLNAIDCRYKSTEHRFTYEFKDIQINLRGDIGFVGYIKIFFTDQEEEDPLREESYRSPYIKIIKYQPHDLEVKKMIEERFNFSGDHLIEIDFRSSEKSIDMSLEETGE